MTACKMSNKATSTAMTMDACCGFCLDDTKQKNCIEESECISHLFTSRLIGSELEALSSANIRFRSAKGGGQILK